MSILKMKQNLPAPTASPKSEKPTSLALAYNVQKQGKKAPQSKVEAEDAPPVTNIAEAILKRSKPKPVEADPLDELDLLEVNDDDLLEVSAEPEIEEDDSLVSKILKKKRSLND